MASCHTTPEITFSPVPGGLFTVIGVPVWVWVAPRSSVTVSCGA